MLRPVPGFVRRTLHPDRYHGHGRSRGPFFEGWYYKIVDAEERARLAIIPGIFLGEDPARSESFVQILDGVSGESHYHSFPVAAFHAAQDGFEVRIAENRFGAGAIKLRIPEAPVEGEIWFSGLTPWPVSWRSPGIMGWYAWVPRMECYHGVVSLDHRVDGWLRLGSETLRLDGGRGYIEKDWGEAFPAGYVWMQSNHFDVPGTCVTASVAIIPWLRRSFRGFLAGVWHEGQLHRFATYTGARIERLEIEAKRVLWAIRGGRLQLELEATRPEGSLLHAPVRSEMHRRVEETLRAEITTRLSRRAGDGWETLFEGTGRCGGLEVHGDLDRLLAG